jgi:hypothetical protein
MLGLALSSEGEPDKESSDRVRQEERRGCGCDNGYPHVRLEEETGARAAPAPVRSALDPAALANPTLQALIWRVQRERPIR